MTTQSPLSPAAAPLASLCKAAGDALRLDILRALARDSYGVLELAQAFGVKQSLLSHHLKTLTQAGLLHSRREGNTIFYRRPPLNLQDPWAEFKQTLFASLDKTPLATPVQHQLLALQNERAATAQAFFKDNAAKFHHQQALIASFDHYGSSILQLLDTHTGPKHRALEIGPGEGECLPLLRQRYPQVHALDTSEAMLAKAQAHCARLNCTGVQFHHGDTPHLATVNTLFDCAVISMVLHHVPSPPKCYKT